MDTVERIDRIIEATELEHKIISIDAGSGNREFERTNGALEALKKAREAITQEKDPTKIEVIGHVIRNIVKICGIPLPPGPEWLHIGDMSELEQDRDNDVRYKVVDQIRGTRIQILKTFLDRETKKSQ